jgi:hypothetical protein
VIVFCQDFQLRENKALKMSTGIIPKRPADEVMEMALESLQDLGTGGSSHDWLKEGIEVNPSVLPGNVERGAIFDRAFRVTECSGKPWRFVSHVHYLLPLCL